MLVDEHGALFFVVEFNGHALIRRVESVFQTLPPPLPRSVLSLPPLPPQGQPIDTAVAGALDWSAPSATFPLLVPLLLPLRPLVRPVLEGLVISVGGVSRRPRVSGGVVPASGAPTRRRGKLWQYQVVEGQ